MDWNLPNHPQLIITALSQTLCWLTKCTRVMDWNLPNHPQLTITALSQTLCWLTKCTRVMDWNLPEHPKLTIAALSQTLCWLTKCARVMDWNLPKHPKLTITALSQDPRCMSNTVLRILFTYTAFTALRIATIHSFVFAGPFLTIRWEYITKISS